MLRRRRPLKSEAIQFSFDSFLDLVTNVVGIIIRLILATWVGARSYHASMQWIDTEQPPAATKTPVAVKALIPPKITDDPLYSKIEIAKQDIEDAKARLTAQLKELETVEDKSVRTKEQLIVLVGQRNQLEGEKKVLTAAKSERGAKVQTANLTVDEIRLRSKKLLEDIKRVEAQPINRKQLKYHAPVSQVVRSDEIFFECKNGRVTFIDLPAFMMEVKQSMDTVSQELRTQWKVEHLTPSVGPYRMRFVIERERSTLDAGATASGTNFRYGLTGWVIEALTANRGETLQAALAPKSEFRQIVDPLDGNISVVTFWVYPDSFEMFRLLRDHLYERGLDVAGRPLPEDSPIAASRQGTASRGQ